MAKRRPADFDLLREVRSSQFTPRIDDLPALFSILASDDEALADDVERAIARVGIAGASDARRRFEGAPPPVRRRLVAIAGRVCSSTPAALDDAALAFLIRALDDDDGRVRRGAVRALASLADVASRDSIERSLLDAWTKHVALEDRRALAVALGKVGGSASLAAFDALGSETSSDAELARRVDEARIKIRRSSRRSPPIGGEAPRTHAIDLDRVPSVPMRVVFRCRGGLEELLVEELASRAHVGEVIDPRVARPGAVEAMLVGPLRSLFGSRVALSFAFPLAPRPPLRDAVDAPRADAIVAEAIASDEAWRIVSSFDRAPIRYRIEWASAGHRRGATFRIAAAVAKKRPAFENDPTASAWEVTIVEAARATFVEIGPRAVDDPRFSWRRADVPASSHPTIAAALARLGGARPVDVVWDPFVGAGAELIERARLGPYRSLVGTDLDARAIEAARENVAAANVANVTFVESDACTFRPAAPPTLVVTNPPMGRRIAVDATSLLERFLRHAVDVLAPDARIAWLSPDGDRTAAVAASLGFAARLRRRVDLGGFSAELQLLVRDRIGR